MTVAYRFRPGAFPTRPWARSVTALAIIASAAACAGDDPVGVSAIARPVKSVASAGTVVQGQYLIVLRDSVADVAGAMARITRDAGATNGKAFGAALKGFSATMSEEAANALSRNPAVALVEADRIVTAYGTQASAPWALDRIDQRLRPLSGSYSWTTSGSGVNIYILDTGIRTTHMQFSGRARSVYGAFGDGWDAADCSGHGTYVAALAGGNDFGSAKGATLNSVRVLDCSANGTTSGVIAGLSWLAANRVLPAVANMSFGLPYSAALNQAVDAVISAGVTVTVAAGNDGTDACVVSPAGVGGAITVGGSTSIDAQASWSNRGSCVDLFAPGTNVISASADGDSYVTSTSGSSASAALAAGAAAMYLEGNRSASPAAVANALISAATTGVMVDLTSGSPNRLLYTGPADAQAPPPPPPPPPPTVDAPPTASLTVSCRKTVCTFDGTRSTDDIGIVRYSWTFGDGAQAATSTATTTHTYASAGSYTATLTVADAAGQTATASYAVRIKGR
jgi:serine protease